MSIAVENITVDIAIRDRWRRSLVRVLDAVTLEVPAGSMTALVGESGCGKSMIASVLTGLLPPGSTASGSLRIDDEQFRDDALVDDPRWRRLRGHRIGFVPQSAATSFTPVRTIGAQLDEVTHELSGGMAQRAAIAVALAGNPDMIVADEPTSALDSELAASVWELLASAAREGAAVLVITHDVETMRLGCDSVAVMRAGRIVEQRRLDQIADSDDAYVAGFFEAAS